MPKMISAYSVNDEKILFGMDKVEASASRFCVLDIVIVEEFILWRRQYVGFVDAVTFEVLSNLYVASPWPITPPRPLFNHAYILSPKLEEEHLSPLWPLPPKINGDVIIVLAWYVSIVASHRAIPTQVDLRIVPSRGRAGPEIRLSEVKRGQARLTRAGMQGRLAPD